MNSVETAEYSVLYATFPHQDEANTVARFVLFCTNKKNNFVFVHRRLVQEGLANFVNTSPGTTTFYRENGDSEEVKSDSEVLLTAKILTRNAGRIVTLVTEEHPVQEPEVFALPVSEFLHLLYNTTNESFLYKHFRLHTSVDQCLEIC